MTIAAALLVAVLAVSGCSNPCVELTDKLCDRAQTDQSDCAATEGDEARKRACERIATLVKACSALREQAPKATDEDIAACKADLELVEALERAQK